MNYPDSYYKNVIGKLLRVSMNNIETTAELIDQMFCDDDFKKQVKLLCDTYMKSSEHDAKLMAKSVDVRALSSLNNICKNNIGIIPLDFSGEETSIYKHGEKINVLFLSIQEKEFDEALLASYALSGAASEIAFSAINKYAKQINDTNPMLEIDNISESIYKKMLEKIKQMPASMRFTLFPKNNEKGSYDVAFFTKTEEINVKKGSQIMKEGPYYVPKLASVILACALIERDEYGKEYEEAKEEKRRLRNAIDRMFYESDCPLYFVPAVVQKNGQYTLFADRNIYFDFNKDDNLSYEEFSKDVETKMSGLNHILIPMSIVEFEKYKNEITIDSKDLEYFKTEADIKAPVYINPEAVKGHHISERLIDIFNRKREEMLMHSDDFNGKNLTNLANYISGSVHEMIMREDEDYSEFEAEQLEIEAREDELLSEIDKKYAITSTFEDHDQVSQMIKHEKENIEHNRVAIERSDDDRTR